ncbi:hypothetical protein DQP55_24065 [Mycolicibacterium sp. GF69]|nr:hypothetical protein DQP55_24065 [Mycolicibacterium sp. GF69]
MDAVECPDCGECFGEREMHWVTNAEGGVMYRLPCDHMAVGTWTDGEVTYGPEHVWAGRVATEHHHRFFGDRHHSLSDELDRLLAEKLHE